ncbi:MULTISPECIES: DUF2066 domain-containing protein [Kordiimonas]|jgi:hypothetical protein|uniref:DUF2066 domain-containing protein n=1 Tax=Kordiimonas TaxID=288021 RepID=UPI00257E45EB|nr:DUF2066 domain-containing protein [Kordiimonas sp. UBA4487]
MKVFMRKLLGNNHLFCIFAAFLSVFAADIAAWAQAKEDPLDRLFTIQAIKVDETASRASEARRVALAKAELMAYEKLLVKLTQPEGRAKLPTMSAREVQAMISGIEVVEEQSSSRRYLATLDVRFEPGVVSQFLAQYNVPHVLGTGRGILVVHGHSRGLQDILWEADATLEAAREQVDWLNRIRQYVFPRGEMAERAMLTYEEVAHLEARDVLTLARRYDVRSALIIASRWHTAGPDGAVLDYRFLNTDGDITGEGRIRNAASEEAAIAAMYAEALEQIDSAWRAQLLVDTGQGGVLDVMVSSTELATYNQVLSRLDDVSLVSDVEQLQIGLPFSQLRFRYTGREDQLVLALRYAGLVLSPYGESQLLALRGDDVDD